jgi:hypothetical protein
VRGVTLTRLRVDGLARCRPLDLDRRGSTCGSLLLASTWREDTVNMHRSALSLACVFYACVQLGRSALYCPLRVSCPHVHTSLVWLPCVFYGAWKRHLVHDSVIWRPPHRWLGSRSACTVAGGAGKARVTGLRRGMRRAVTEKSCDHIRSA